VSGLRVLAITADRAFLREVRVVLPLAALERRGYVAGFRLLDPVTGALSGHESLDSFDAVLVQREAPLRVLRYLSDAGLPFVYDLDDLLISPASYRQHTPSCGVSEFVTQATRQCHKLMVTNAKLLSALEKHVDMKLAGKTILAPNLCPLREPFVRSAKKPSCLVWTSSDLPALTSSKENVVRAVQDFAQSNGLPVLLVGTFDPAIVRLLPAAKFLGPMDYWHHKLFLLNLPPSIGLAPLETGADPQTQEFIDCKSDVKMVEYGGFGHAAVYSRAVAHIDSDLRAGVLAENTTESWRQALEEALSSPAGRWEEESRAIVQIRAAETAAPTSWGTALSEARLTQPIKLRQVLHGFGFKHLSQMNAQSGYPPHYRLADILYHGLYMHFTPEWLRRRFGRWLSHHLH